MTPAVTHSRPVFLSEAVFWGGLAVGVVLVVCYYLVVRRVSGAYPGWVRAVLYGMVAIGAALAVWAASLALRHPHWAPAP